MKQKFSKDINSFASEVEKRKIIVRKQRSKYTNPEESNVAVSGLWFTVSGKIRKIGPSP